MKPIYSLCALLVLAVLPSCSNTQFWSVMSALGGATLAQEKESPADYSVAPAAPEAPTVTGADSSPSPAK